MNIKNKKFWLITILITITLLLVIPSYQQLANTQNYVLKIDDFILYPNQFKTLVNNNLYYLTHNTSLKKNTLKYKQYKKKIQQQILNQIIIDTLQKKYIHQLDYNITNNKIKNNIFNNPLFLDKNNKFNKQKYLSYLTENKINIYQYINILKDEIKNKELIHNLITLLPWNYNNQLIIKNLKQIRSYKIAVIKMDNLIKNNTTIHKINNNEFLDTYFNHKNIFTPIQYNIQILDLNKNINVNQLYKIKQILFIKNILKKIKNKKLYIYKTKKHINLTKFIKNISNKNIPFIKLPTNHKFKYIDKSNLSDIKLIYKYLYTKKNNKKDSVTNIKKKLHKYYYIFLTHNHKKNTYNYKYHYHYKLHKKYNWIIKNKIFLKKLPNLYNNFSIKTKKKLYKYILKNIHPSNIYQNNYTIKNIKYFFKINKLSKIYLFLKNKNNIKNTIAYNTNNNIYLIKYQKYIPKHKKNSINIIYNIIKTLILKQKVSFTKKWITNLIDHQSNKEQDIQNKYIKWNSNVYFSTHKKNNIFSKYILHMKLSNNYNQNYIFLYDYTKKTMYLLKLINIKYPEDNQLKLNKFINSIYTNISLILFNKNLSKNNKIIYNSHYII